MATGVGTTESVEGGSQEGKEALLQPNDVSLSIG